jgi:hypothetical protein
LVVKHNFNAPFSVFIAPFSVLIATFLVLKHDLDLTLGFLDAIQLSMVLCAQSTCASSCMQEMEKLHCLPKLCNPTIWICYSEPAYLH